MLKTFASLVMTITLVMSSLLQFHHHDEDGCLCFSFTLAKELHFSGSHCRLFANKHSDFCHHCQSPLEEERNNNETPFNHDDSTCAFHVNQYEVSSEQTLPDVTSAQIFDLLVADLTDSTDLNVKSTSLGLFYYHSNYTPPPPNLSYTFRAPPVA